MMIEDFDVHFELAMRFFESLRTLGGSYRNVHLEVLAPDAVVVTRNDDIFWTDTTGTEGGSTYTSMSGRPMATGRSQLECPATISLRVRPIAGRGAR